MNCSRCSGQAVILIRYSGVHLCRSHFLSFVERRVKNELGHQLGRIRGDEHIVAAVSGGKDSLVMLHLLRKIYRRHRKITITALTVDEGIAGYRPHALDRVKAYCAGNDIPLEIATFGEYDGYPLDSMVPRRGEMTPCAICGIFRRRCMNTRARELGATRLATGHNLDDTAQTVLMNLTRADLKRMVRMGPHRIVKPGMIPRILPLRLIPEKECYLYAVLSGIDFHDGVCPYYDLAQRNIYRRILGELENGMPGTRHSLVRTFDLLYEPLLGMYPELGVSTCQQCGEPTSGTVCKGCETVEKLRMEGRCDTVK